MKQLLLIFTFATLATIIALVFVYFSANGQVQNTPIFPILRQLGMEKDKPVVKINDVKIYVDVAKTAEEQARGLSNREKLGKNEGMLFVFKNKTYPGFWMKDMLFPIDIIWIADNKIVGIEKNVSPPEPVTRNAQLHLYKPPMGIDYVLEVNGGFCDSKKINVGNIVKLP